MIFYEAPHRLLDTLEELEGIFGGERESAVIRELTKKFEEVRRGTIGNQRIYFKEKQPKGEFVIVIDGLSLEEQRKEAQASWEEISIHEHIQRYLSQGFNEKDAMKQVAKDRGVSKRDIYKEYKANE